ncbi:putative ADP-ribosylation factor GTPase-activating protein AGD14-like [Capsicum annuum]|nr:putative ADP-ribosylation factor GTPase-activating protein AGD14-like [Capsicum annuum]
MQFILSATPLCYGVQGKKDEAAHEKSLTLKTSDSDEDIEIDEEQVAFITKNFTKFFKKKSSDKKGTDESDDKDVDETALMAISDSDMEEEYAPTEIYKISFGLITLRFYQGGDLIRVRSDKDTIDILKILGNGQVLKAFVYHMVGEPELAPPFLKFVSDGEGHVEGKSGVSFNKDIENNIGSVDKAPKNSEDFDQSTAHIFSPTTVQPTAHTFPSFVKPTAHISSPSTDQPNAHVSSPPTDQPTPHVFSPIVVTPSSSTIAPSSSTVAPSSSTTAPTNSTIAPSSSTVAPTNSHTAPFESFVDSDVESIDGGVEIGSDMDKYVDKELRGLKEEKGKIKRRKREERPVILEHIKLETRRKGPDIGYDESVSGDRNSLEDDVTDEEDEVEQVEHIDKARKRKNFKRVIYSSGCQKVVWELRLVFESVNEFRAAITKYAVVEHVAMEKYVNELTRGKVRCTTDCPWLLYASIDSRFMNFVMKTYNTVHKCNPINRNKLCNTKFLLIHFNERIKEHPDIRIFEFQLLIKKELDLHIGRTMCRREKNKVIAELMRDYNLKFERILDYRDELLRSNPGSTCVVKLHDEIFEDGRKIFQGFYICFDAMKKSFLADVATITEYLYYATSCYEDARYVWKEYEKEEGETKKKTRKLSKREIEISCSTCHSKGHNKRRCPTGALAAGTNENPNPSSSVGANSSAGPSAAPTVEKGRGST